jgi:hypothetical protein
MFRTKGKVTSLLLAILTLTLCIVVTTAFVLENSQVSANTIPIVFSQEGVDPLEYDLASYAKDQNITTDEAKQRFEIRSKFDGLGQQLSEKESDTFGGIYIQHQPEYRIVVLFTRDGAGTIAKYLDASLQKHVKILPAKVSLKQLKSDQVIYTSVIKESGVMVGSGINIIDGVVEISVALKDASNLADEIQKRKIVLPDDVKVVEVDELPQPATDIYGGLVPDGGANTGTLGFSIVNAYGTRGVTNAGHVTVAVSYLSTNLPVQMDRTDTYYDIQWHTAPGFTVLPQIQWYQYGNTRTITGYKPYADMYYQDYVLKWGKTTGYNGGYIVSLNEMLPWVNNSAYTFIRVHNANVYPLATSGDSGGPWFWGNTAWGTSCGTQGATGDGWFMAIDYLQQGLGVYLLTN